MAGRCDGLSISQTQLDRLRKLISTGHGKQFYWWSAWAKCRERVLAYDRYECQLCKAQGRYRKAEIVHHVKHLRDRPELALSLYDPETGERQLISVCKACHEEQHQEALRPYQPAQPPVTPERWD